MGFDLGRNIASNSFLGTFVQNSLYIYQIIKYIPVLWCFLGGVNIYNVFFQLYIYISPYSVVLIGIIASSSNNSKQWYTTNTTITTQNVIPNNFWHFRLVVLKWKTFQVHKKKENLSLICPCCQQSSYLINIPNATKLQGDWEVYNPG